MDQRQRLEEWAANERFGVITRSQAEAVGITDRQIRRRVARRQWLSSPVAGAYVLAAFAEEPLSALLAATEALDGVAWARSALAVRGLADHPRRPVVATARRHRGARVEVVDFGALAEVDTVIRNGIRTVSAEMALVSAARQMSLGELNARVDAALRGGHTTWPLLRSCAEQFLRRGRNGSANLRRLLEDRAIDPAVPLSDWGRRFAEDLDRAGMPRPMLEWRVAKADGSLLAQVDLAYPQWHLAIELDSVEFHLRRDAFEVDRRRDGELARVGWRCQRFTWQQYRHEWPWVLAVIRAQILAV